MNRPASEHPQFTLRQLLLTVTAIAVVLAIAAPWVRRLMGAEFGPAALMELVGPLSPILLILLVVAFGLALVLGISAIRSRRTSAAVWIEGLAHGIGLIGVLLLVAAVVPAFEKVFKEFEIPLPRTTLYLIVASNAVARYAYVVVPLMVAVVVTDVRIFRRLYDSPIRRPWARAWSAAITGLLMAVFVVSVYALFAPLTCVVHRLTGGDC